MPEEDRKAEADFQRRARHADVVSMATPLRWTDQELIAILHDAAEARGSTPSVPWYNRVSPGRGWPSSALYIQRFGRWQNAIQLAGLAPNRGPGVGHAQVYREGDCRSAIRMCAREVGRPPTIKEYERFRDRTAGRTPSVPTLRNRYGGWVRALAALLDLDPGVERDRARRPTGF